MKTAEEWRLVFLGWNRRLDNLPSDAEVKAIQLDAYKAGMTRAAEIAGASGGIQTAKGTKQAILTERDNLKELP